MNNDAWKAGDYAAEHFLWAVEDRVATVTLNRPERKNPLTFESYAELRDTVPRAWSTPRTCKAVVITGAGGNFCSGGDVHEIIGPLTGMTMPGLLAFTRMTGDLVKAMRACPQPIVAAIDGVCAGAGAIIAMASRHSHRDAGDARPPSCSPASASPAATWAPARSCRASSARAAPPNCSSPAAR